LERHLGELNSVLMKGRAPESLGIAGRPKPLSPQEAQKAGRMVQELQQDIGRLKQYFGRTIDDSQSLALTYMWASVLLGKMEEVLRSLRPVNLEKSRGLMPAEYRKVLEEILPRMEQNVTALRDRYSTSKRQAAEDTR